MAMTATTLCCAMEYFSWALVICPFYIFIHKVGFLVFMFFIQVAFGLPGFFTPYTLHPAFWKRKMAEGGGNGMNELAAMVSSSSCANQTPSPLPRHEAASKYYPYPAPLARFEAVVASSTLFMATLEKLHASMGTKFMIPTIGGKELDLHRLFVEVTSRGGFEKIIQLRRWKEVTAVFNFPSTATNASFVLRKYYVSLLHHYEQIYLFKAKGWTHNPSDSLQTPPSLPKAFVEAPLPSPEIQPAATPQQSINTAEFLPGASPGLLAGSLVNGVIDGKFESGYLVTIAIGSEELKGVVYQAPQNPVTQSQQQNYSLFVGGADTNNTASSSSLPRRRRRKKSEIKKRDPAHPKTNRSGYNFFFAEQHARLKPLHPGKDRDISRMIGELWTKLKDNEKDVYREQAIKDKERYRIELEEYKRGQRTGQTISDAVPIQQQQQPSQLPETDSNMVEADENIEDEDTPHTPKNDEDSSDKSESENDKTISDMEEEASSPRAEVGMETSTAGEVAFEKIGDESNVCLVDVPMEKEKESAPSEER